MKTKDATQHNNNNNDNRTHNTQREQQSAYTQQHTNTIQRHQHIAHDIITNNKTTCALTIHI